MRVHANAFLADVGASPDSPEAGVAYRAAGINSWFAGDYREARDCLERALALFQPVRDDDLTYRFGHDEGVAAMLFLALALWPLGDIERAVLPRCAALKGVSPASPISPRLQYGKSVAALFELMRGDLRSPRKTPLNSDVSYANMICRIGGRTRSFWRAG